LKVRSGQGTTFYMPVISYRGQRGDLAGNLRALRQRDMMLSIGSLGGVTTPGAEMPQILTTFGDYTHGYTKKYWMPVFDFS